MFIAMNRFRISPGREAEFIEVWRQRDSHLAGVPGFGHFHLLQGPGDAQVTRFTRTPRGTVRRPSRLGRTRKRFAQHMPVQASSADSTLGHRILRVLRPCCSKRMGGKATTRCARSIPSTSSGS